MFSCAVFSCAVSSAFAQENRNQHNLLLLSSSQQALRGLQQSCRLWSQQSLRSSASDLSHRYGIPIWIDRRIDPTQIVNLTQPSEEATLGEELRRLALSCGADSGLVENVYLIAPQGKLSRIQKAAVVFHGQLSATDRALSKASRSLEWSDITSTTELLDLIAETWKVQIDGELPHDLFYAGKFPPSSLATQISILLGGFDLQAQIASEDKILRSSQTDPADADPTLVQSSAKSEARVELNSRPFVLKLKPLSENHHWQDSYTRNVDSDALSYLRERFPEGTILQNSKSQVLVIGETNLHNEVLSIGMKAAARKVLRSTEEQPRYSFRIDAKLPVDVVLDSLAKNFQFTLEWSESVKPAQRNRLIQLNVENVTRQELLEQVCAQAELSFEDQGAKFIIGPK